MFPKEDKTPETQESLTPYIILGFLGLLTLAGTTLTLLYLLL